MIGFGLDLSGYATKKTSLVAINSRDDHADVTLLRNSVFSLERNTNSSIVAAAREEAAVLSRCIKLGPISVDIPIDLQGLPFPENPVEIWQLTRRPIDKKLGAMPPFADRIGAPVTRFSAILGKSNAVGLLGVKIFETYPSKFLRNSGIGAGYKSTDLEIRAAALENICRALKFDRIVNDDDDIDAIICAISSVAPREHLLLGNDFGLAPHELAKGFRLLKSSPFASIHLLVEDFASWVAREEKDKM